MKNSRYQEFIFTLTKEFVQLIHKTESIPVNYKNEDYEGISLEELERLDNKFINQSPEGGVIK
jgi:hypothetical protein